ncbi:MAG TPA: hypothetical protein PLM16_03250, partial [Candidatus Woesebacteria bacterium]|nr:hypothetical protein [Candidatus Woesebacteria bacterium]
MQEHQQVASSEVNVHVSSHKSKNIVLFVIILLLLGVVGVGAYYLGKTEFNIEFSRRKPDQTKNEPEFKDDRLTPTQGLEPTVAPISGELKRLDRDLALFKVLNPSDSMIESHVYYEAGKLSGEWEVYTRIVAIRSQEGPGLPETYILATKDFQEYVLNDSANKTTRYQETDWESPLYLLDQGKVVKTAVFDSSLPEVINLNDQYVLYYSGLLTQYQETNKRDQYGNTIAEYHLKNDLSNFQPLSSPVSHLKMFFEPAHIDQSYIDEMPPETQAIMRSKANYILGDTNVIVVDSIGVPAIYSLTTPDAIKLTKQAEVSHGQKRLQYQEALKKYEAGEISDYPQYPESPGIPDLGFDRNVIIAESDHSFFDTYQTAFPSACALATPGTVVKVQDNDLEQIGTVFGLPLFRLKAEQHDLNKLAYQN